MLETLHKIWAWVSSFWERIPADEKTRIIKFIVDSFDAILRAFFHAKKSEASV